MNYQKKDTGDLDYSLWKKFKDFFEEKNFINYDSFGIIDKKYSEIYNPKSGLSEVGNIISSKAISDNVSWINLSPVFRYKNLALVAVAKNDMALFDTMTFAAASPVKAISFKKGLNVATELNYFYNKSVKTKEQRKAVYQAFLDLSKEEKIPIGHDFVLSDEFSKKYTETF